MSCAFRVGRRAGGIEQPPDRVGVVFSVGQRRGVALRERPVGHEHAHAAALLRERCSHGLEIEFPPNRWDDQDLRCRLTGDETDFAFAVDRQHGVLDCTQTAQRSDQDQRLEPRRELPRHHVVDTDAMGGKTCRRPFGLHGELGEGQGPHVLIDREKRVGGGVDTCLDQLPQRASLQHRASSRIQRPSADRRAVIIGPVHRHPPRRRLSHRCAGIALDPTEHDEQRRLRYWRRPAVAVSSSIAPDALGSQWTRR